jgi:hypothetical protein
VVNRSVWNEFGVIQAHISLSMARTHERSVSYVTLGTGSRRPGRASDKVGRVRVHGDAKAVEQLMHRAGQAGHIRSGG